MRIRVLILVTLFIVDFSACKKLVHKEYQEFIGDWQGYIDRGCYSHIVIDENSNGTWDKGGSSDCDFHASGLVKIREDKLNIGHWKFKIISFPRKITSSTIQLSNNAYANWEMTIECSSRFCNKGEVTYYRE